MTPYNPFDWYWQRGEEIYSSARQTIIGGDDETHAAWLAAGNLPTPWPRDASGNQTDLALAEVLAAHGIPGPNGANASPVPPEISRRQCARQMLAMDLIDGPEALAMARNGEPPAMVAALIDALPAAQRVPALIDFAATTYRRDNPLLVALMTASGHSEGEINDFFRDAAVL